MKFSEILARPEFEKITGRFGRVKTGVVGDVMLDKFVWGEVRRISPEAPVPVVEVRKEDFVLGGAGNVAANIKSLGGKVFLVSAVGRDENGKQVAALLKERGIGNHLFVRDSIPTITKTRIIARTQQLVRIDWEQKASLPHPDAGRLRAILTGRFPDFDGLVISDYGKGFVTPALINRLGILARNQGRILTVDPKIEHFSYYRRATCITPNRLEASQGMHLKEPESHPELAALGRKIMRKLKCQNLLITLGKEGMMLFEEKGRVLHIPAVAREVFDVTGAGDTVIAALTLALAAGAGILQAAIISNFAAGVVVGKLGTATLTREELVEFYRKQSASFHVERLE
jgi:D-beta-D-heptose 7-phosphate kinase/D-beta-D-heptose 1-phosphate adenosyltransferase